MVKLCQNYETLEPIATKFGVIIMSTMSPGTPKFKAIAPVGTSRQISKLLFDHHLNPDDTQLFFSFHPSNFDSSITHVQNSVQQVSSWLTSFF